MPRLIKIDKKLEKTFTHKKCGAVIGYFDKELRTNHYTDMGGGRNTQYILTCPNCGENVVVRED